MAACSSEVTPSTSLPPIPSGAYVSTIPALPTGIDPLEVVVTDDTGLLTGVAPFKGLLPDGWDGPDGAVGYDHDLTHVVFAWMGGACDARAQLTVTGGPAVSFHTIEQNVDYCDDLGISRSVVLTFSRAIASSSGTDTALASLPSACPTEITATTDLSCEWWVDRAGSPSHLVVMLPGDAAPARISRDHAVQIGHDSVSFDGEPTAAVHGQTDVFPGKPASAWMIVEYYPNPSPHQVSGPCCDGPYWATTNVAGVVISDQTGETLVSWESGGSSPPPDASSSPSTTAIPLPTGASTATALAVATPFQSPSPPS